MTAQGGWGWGWGGRQLVSVVIKTPRFDLLLLLHGPEQQVQSLVGFKLAQVAAQGSSLGLQPSRVGQESSKWGSSSPVKPAGFAKARIDIMRQVGVCSHSKRLLC